CTRDRGLDGVDYW
nr:immunoglobulin heavy chain junction region [Macaca mulatta]